MHAAFLRVKSKATAVLTRPRPQGNKGETAEKETTKKKLKKEEEEKKTNKKRVPPLVLPILVASFCPVLGGASTGTTGSSALSRCFPVRSTGIRSLAGRLRDESVNEIATHGHNFYSDSHGPPMVRVPVIDVTAFLRAGLRARRVDGREPKGRLVAPS